LERARGRGGRKLYGKKRAEISINSKGKASLKRRKRDSVTNSMGEGGLEVPLIYRVAIRPGRKKERRCTRVAIRDRQKDCAEKSRRAET